jgi:hypothetical protein
MPGNLQPLADKFAIVNPDGTPTQYFIRWAQERQIDIQNGISAEQAQELIDTWAAARHIIAGTGLGGGGTLDNDVTLDLNAGLGDLNDVDFSTPPTAGQTIRFDGTSGKFKPASGGGGGGDYTKIDEVICAASQTGVAFASIPSGYRDLIITWTARSQNTTGDDGLQFIFNSDTGANYQRQQFFVDGSSTAMSRVTGQNSLSGAQIAANGNPATHIFDSGELIIGNYDDTTHWKSVRGITTNSFSNTIRLLEYAGYWQALAAIAQIDINLGGSAFVDGSVFSLYARG